MGSNRKHMARRLEYPHKACKEVRLRCHVDNLSGIGHVPSKELLDGMATAAEDRMAEFSSQNISNTVLAYAKMEYNPGDLMDAAAKVALAKLDTFTPQVIPAPALLPALITVHGPIC